MNATSKTAKSRTIFIVACLLVVASYFLMGGSADADIFSTRRVVIAPTVCLAGYLLIIIGILRKG
jgi:hypothetical protein